MLSTSFSKHRIKYILGCLIIMEVADGFLTNALLQRELGREANPFLLGIAGESSFLIIKIVGVLLAVVILWDVSRRFPRAAFWTSAAFLLVYTAVVIWNLRLLILG